MIRIKKGSIATERFLPEREDVPGTNITVYPGGVVTFTAQTGGRVVCTHPVIIRAKQEDVDESLMEEEQEITVQSRLQTHLGLEEGFPESILRRDER